MQLYRQMNQLYQKQNYFEAIEAGHQALKQALTPLNPEEECFDYDLIAQIYDRLATIHLDLNNPQQATNLLVKQVKLEKLQPKVNWLRLGSAYAKIGKACFYSCKYDESVHFLKMAKQLLEDNGHTHTNEMGFTLAQLGNYYRFMFQDQDAEKSLKDSIEIRRGIFTENSVEVAESLHGLAQLYTDMGQVEQASQIIDQAIQILTNTLGRKHIRTAKSIYLKGNLCLRFYKPDLEKAESYIKESLDINKSVVGEHFLDTADCYHSLGKILAADKADNTGFQEVPDYFMKALSILQDIYGKEHACIAVLLNNLGRAYYERKLYEQAAQCFTRSILIYNKICGGWHGNLAISLKSAADCNKHLGLSKVAHRQYSQSLEIYKGMNTDFSYTINQIEKSLKETETEE